MFVPYQAYFAVCSGWPHTEDEHQKFHQSLWAAKSDSGVSRLILGLLDKSSAAKPEKMAVVEHLQRDWQNSRVLVSMASSVTVAVAGDFAKTIAAVREKAGLSIPDLARASGISDDAIRRYESGDRKPTWDAVQKLAKALGVSTVVFRAQ